MTSTTTEPEISPERAAASTLARCAFVVRKQEHGDRWIVRDTTTTDRLMLLPADLELAARLTEEQNIRSIAALRAALEATVAPAEQPPAPPTALSLSLQDIARSYLAAQQRSGEALLEAAGWLAEARAKARHGEWGIFLEATRTSGGTAKRLLDIHALAQNDPQFADAVRSNWIGTAVAGELAQPSTPPAVRQRLLAGNEPPTKAEVQRARADVKSAAVAEMAPTQKTPIDEIAGRMAAALEEEFGIPVEVVDYIGDRPRTPDPAPGAYFWGQIPGAIESHQWRWVAAGRWESRCEKIATHEPGTVGTGRRCLVCANGAGATRCGEAGCADESVGDKNICGIKMPRCLRHTEEARAQQQEDEVRAGYPDMARLRAACERAERLGATVDYMRQRSDGRVPVQAPTGHGVSWDNAEELEGLCVAWEGHARRQQEAATGINWYKVDKLTFNLGTARDVGRALDRWLALGQELLPASFDMEGLRVAVAAAVEAPQPAPDPIGQALDQVAAVEAAGLEAQPAAIQAARRALDASAALLTDADYENLAGRLSAVEKRIKEVR